VEQSKRSLRRVSVRHRLTQRQATPHARSHEGRLLDSALRLGERGLSVFPLAPSLKVPARGLTDWEHQATTDPDQIQKWWENVGFNVGVACGPSGLLVVDCDVKPGIDGRREYIDFLTSNGLERSPNTFMVETPTRGMHIYHRAPADQTLGNTAGKLAPAVDTRATGGYVVGPGSVTSVGEYRIYRDMDIAPAPEALIEALTAKRNLVHAGSAPAVSPRYFAGALRNELQRVAEATQGTRNHELNRASFALGQLTQGLDRDDVMAQLVAAGMEAGLPERECLRTVESGFSAGEATPREVSGVEMSQV
jgi:hypothetical protein